MRENREIYSSFYSVMYPILFVTALCLTFLAPLSGTFIFVAMHQLAHLSILNISHANASFQGHEPAWIHRPLIPDHKFCSCQIFWKLRDEYTGRLKCFSCCTNELCIVKCSFSAQIKCTLAVVTRRPSFSSHRLPIQKLEALLGNFRLENRAHSGSRHHLTPCVCELPLPSRKTVCAETWATGFNRKCYIWAKTKRLSMQFTFSVREVCNSSLPNTRYS